MENLHLPLGTEQGSAHRGDPPHSARAGLWTGTGWKQWLVAKHAVALAPFPSKGHLCMAPEDWERATGSPVTPSTLVLEGNACHQCYCVAVTEATGCRWCLGCVKICIHMCLAAPLQHRQMEQF